MNETAFSPTQIANLLERDNMLVATTSFPNEFIGLYYSIKDLAVAAVAAVAAVVAVAAAVAAVDTIESAGV
jgi:hypothetical protein